MRKQALFAVAVLLVLFLVAVAMQPDRYHVERSTVVFAPLGVVYGQVADFRAWEAWSPWEKLDPAMQRTFDGAAGTVGASYAWKGNADVGAGTMTITEAQAPHKLTMRLDFIEPFASTTESGFTITPAESGVKVTWWMDGENDFMGKLFCMFMDMDAMIGSDFERGLAQLKTVAEAITRQRNTPKTAATEPESPSETAQAQEATGPTP